MERATFAGIAVVMFDEGGNARFDKHGWRNIRVGLFLCAQLHLCHLVGKESAFSLSLFLGLDLHLVIRLLVGVGECVLLGKILEQSS